MVKTYLMCEVHTVNYAYQLLENVNLFYKTEFFITTDYRSSFGYKRKSYRRY